MGSPSSTVSNKQVRFLRGRLVDKKLLEMQPEKSGILSATTSCCSPLDQSWSVMVSRASPRPEQASPASTDSQCDVRADFSVLCPRSSLIRLSMNVCKAVSVHIVVGGADIGTKGYVDE